jgi:glycosyltransferase involved in cell wall biosynthesis
MPAIEPSQSPKKVIIFSANSSWYLKNFRESTLLRFIEEGFEVVCLAPNDHSTEDLQKLGCKFIHLEMDNKGINIIRDIKLIVKFYKLFRTIKPFAVFNFTIKNNIYGALASALTRTTVVSHVTGLGTAIIHGGFIGLVVKILYRISQAFSKIVFCQNLDDRQFFLDNNLISQTKLKLIPGSGINLDKYSQASKQSRNDVLKEHPTIFLYAGRIMRDKGLIELVEAMRLINSKDCMCELLIHGFIDNLNISSIPESEIDSWSKISGVKWCGPSDNIAKIMENVDCVVLPSYREGMPRLLLEGAAMSLPLIATDVPGCREIVSNGVNGFLCKSRDVSSLAEKMQHMHNLSSRQRKEMGDAGRRIVEERFSETIVINAALQALD